MWQVVDVEKIIKAVKYCKNKKAASCENRPMKGGVVPLGVEPRTHGFSVHCSTT